MGRPRKRSLFPIALSIEATAEALDIPKRVLVRAIEENQLAAFGPGPGRRVRVIVADAVQWVRTYWPRATKRKRSIHHDA